MRARWNGLAVFAVILGIGVAPILGARGADSPGSDTEASPGVVLGGDITLSGTRDAVLALAGSIVVSDAHMSNLTAASGDVRMVSGDIGRLAVAGGTVTLDGGQVGDVLAAAGDFKINSRVSGNLLVAAGTTVFTKDAAINGNVALSGGDIAIDGTTGGNLSAEGEHISLAGTIGGNVSLKGADVTIAPGTHIGGNLTYTGPAHITLPPDATVGGKILQRMSSEVPKRNAWRTAALDRAISIARIVGLGGLALCGIALLLARPPLLASTEKALVHALPASVLTGFIAACALPIGIIILSVTVIGIPLAVLVAATGAAVTGVGVLAVCGWIGNMVRQRLGQPDPPVLARRVGWAAVGFVAFIAVGLIPLVGGFAQSIAVLAGSGAVILSLWR